MIVKQRVAKATATSLTYPGAPESVPTVRRLVRLILAHSPRVDDMELIVAELVTNAITHTPSGQEGGTFTITIRQRPGQARLEVADLGTARWRPALAKGDGMAEHGRGLEIVAALADDVGYGVSNGYSRFSWATLSWLADSVSPGCRWTMAWPNGGVRRSHSPLGGIIGRSGRCRPAGPR
jgi:serine/threonine-protein kinase RsbW